MATQPPLRRHFTAHHIIEEESVYKINEIKKLTNMLSSLFDCQSESITCYQNTAIGYLFHLIYQETETITSTIHLSRHGLDIERQENNVNVTVNK
ncbi:hypothetical protein QE177_01625 [Arsenophonus sp. aPb]|uniref:hypothetical protein n=1 Tax=Arsenophonus sp. aPb TaxID=3041619 RepID=UPI0024689541|nr:hypothetical protein [Arsenophonus sp. aPb]WGL98634.1 hypothetical protein QE177_01625 [Arsenophonus sp. aPb]